MAGVERIELPLTVLETAALPLYYSPVCRFPPTDFIIAQMPTINQVEFTNFSENSIATSIAAYLPEPPMRQKAHTGA